MTIQFDFSDSKPMPTVEKWQLAVRQLDEVRRNLPLETTVSLPIPAPGSISMFLFRTRQKQEEYVIDGKVTLKLPGLEPLDVVLSQEESPFPGLSATVPVSNISGDSNELDALLNIYDLLLNKYPSEAAGALGEQWLESFHHVTPKTLIPFYEALNPEFFSWCGGS